MSWIESLSSLLRVAPRRIRDVVGCAFIVAVLVDTDSVVRVIQWLGEAIAQARLDQFIESTRA